jgi:ABC-type nitrate/sulfonate/bicarbonate transport system substrate-binding protein
MGDRLLRLGGVPEHFNLPWHHAIESTELADLDLAWEDQYGGTGEMVAKLADGTLDLVSILTEGTVAAIDRGLPVTILQVYVASPLQWGVFVPGASSIDDIAQLAGARVAVSRFGSGSHLMAYIQAQANGWTIDPARFVVVGGLDGAVESFATGSSDLFLWDQYMTRPLVESGAFRQLGVQETPWPSFVFAVRDEVLRARTTEVGRVVDRVTTEAAGLHTRAGVTEEIAARYGLGVETVRSWLSATRFQPRSGLDLSMIGSVRDALAGAGVGSDDQR